jgi:hypothetical protein
MFRTSLVLSALCALALNVMALGATGAQAEVGAKWLLLTAHPNELKEGSTLHASVGLEKDSSELVLHSKILGIQVSFLCTEVKAVNAKLLAEGNIGKEAGVVSGSQVLFSGCTTDLNGVTSTQCVPTDPTDGTGFIVSKLAHASLALGASGEDLLKVLPDTGETFATIKTGPEKANECPIGTNVPVIGKLFLKDGENLALTHLVKHLLEPGPGTELWVIGKTVEHVATLLGSAWAELSGEHEGLEWSGDPASGEAGAKWLILTAHPNELKEGSTLHASVGLEKDSSELVLHSKILGIQVSFLCTEVKAVNAKLLAEGNIGKEAGVVSGSQVLFSGCTTDLNGVTSTQCVPTDPTDGTGFIVSKLAHASLALGASGEDLLKVLPDTGETFATIKTGPEKANECPIGTNVPVIGKLFLKDGENLALTHLVKHLLEPGPGTELWVIGKTVEHVATLLGSAWARLTGEDEGLEWSGDPA